MQTLILATEYVIQIWPLQSLKGNIRFICYYRYQTLATTTDQDQNEKENVSSGKRLVADWVLGLGEPATQLEVLQGSTEDPEVSSKIIVLGARNVFILHHTGVLIFCKKLDFPPVAMLSYPSGKLLSLFLN